MVEQSRILGGTDRQIPFAEAVVKLPVIIDVRSAKEHREGALPGSINIPLFDDEERKLVGTIYRHGGPKQAADTGFELVQSKLDEFIALFEPYQHGEIGVFCARGGMRSRSVVNLLNEYGFSAWQLQGGYKEYRHFLLENLNGFRPDLIVLHGLTGTGKTRILQRLEHSIDLEGLAQHRSSLFGALGLKPRSQKNFDAQLYGLIHTLCQEPYFIEGESRKLGNIYLPAGLAEAMQRGHLVLITAPLEKRIDRIVEDYPIDDEKTEQKVIAILKKLIPRLGHIRVNEMCGMLKKRELRELVRILFLEYYDKRYGNSMSDYRYEATIDAESIDAAVDGLIRFRQAILQDT